MTHDQTTTGTLLQVTEPDFAAQNGEWAGMSTRNRRFWFCNQMVEMRRRGATFFQQAVDNADNPKLALVEGWRVAPQEIPTPCFQMVPLRGLRHV